MPRTTPLPRARAFYGKAITNVAGARGTWLEGEEFCYFREGCRDRRCYALCEDGELHLCYCELPDSATSIPAHRLIRGRGRVEGYIYADNLLFMFHEYKEQPTGKYSPEGGER